MHADEAYQLNVNSNDDVIRVVDTIVREFNGRLDVFVANAGIPWTQGAALGGEVSHYQDVIHTDLDGTYYSALAAGKYFRRQYLEGTNLDGKPLGKSYTGGSFIATASISGRIVNIPQLQTAYNTAKAGVAHIEWVKFARVNSVSPGYIATEISNFISEETKVIWRSKIPMG
jgi:sorbose reductase